MASGANTLVPAPYEKAIFLGASGTWNATGGAC